MNKFTTIIFFVLKFGITYSCDDFTEDFHSNRKSNAYDFLFAFDTLVSLTGQGTLIR